MTNTDNSLIETVDPQAREQLTLHFDAELSRLRCELLQQIGAIDVLNGAQRDSSVRTFCQRLEVMQYDFLRAIGNFRKQGCISTAHSSIRSGFAHDAKANILAAGAGAGAGFVALQASQIIVVETLTKGFLFWKTTADVALVAKVAALLGIGLGPAGLLIAVLCGVPTYLLARALTRPLMAKLVRKLIVGQFDAKTAPQLRDWAGKQMA